MFIVNRFSTILIGSASAQAVSLIFLVIITRIYSPTEYGQFAAILLAHTALLPFVLLKLDTFFIVTKLSPHFLNLALSYSIKPIAFLSLISTILFLITFPIIPNYAEIIPQVYLAILVSYVSNVANSILYHYSRVKYVIFSSLIQVFSIGVLQVVFAVLSVTSQSLLFAFIVGKVIGLLPFVVFLRIKRKDISPMSGSESSDLVGKETQMKLVSGWAKFFGFFDALLSLFPIIICVFYFNSELLGILMLFLTIVYGPATMLGNSLTIAALTARRFGIEEQDHSEFQPSGSRFKLTSLRLAILYFFSINALILVMKYFNFLDPDLTVVLLLALSAAIQLANTDDFVRLVIKLDWRSLTFIYSISFLITTAITASIIYLQDDTKVWVLTNFFFLKSVLLFIGFKIFSRK